MTLDFESGTLHAAMQPESDARVPPGDLDLIQPPSARAVRPLSALFRGRSRDVCLVVADFKATLEEWVTEHPEDYAGLALLGELNVRIGLNGPARELLYRASLLKPPTWEAFQRTSLLLRRAEAELTHEFTRTPGAPPPVWVRRAASALVERIRGVFARVRISRPTAVA
jgi:hypothetical protein